MSDAPEPVFTVFDLWDGPRSGVASYLGHPHAFQCVFDEMADEWSDVYLLKPITDQELSIVLEGWSIWVSWFRAWRSGQATLSSHPCLPQDRARHIELEQLITPILHVAPENAIRVRGRFSGGQAEDGAMQVTWRVVVAA